MLSVKGDRSLVFLYVIRYEIEHFLEQGQQNYSGFLIFAQDETSLIRLKQAVGWKKNQKIEKDYTRINNEIHLLIYIKYDNDI